MSLLNNNNLSYLDRLNMFENMLDLLEESVTLEPTSQQKKLFDTWFKTGNEEYDRERMNQYLNAAEVRKELVKEKNSIHISGVNKVLFYSNIFSENEDEWYSEDLPSDYVSNISYAGIFHYCAILNSLCFTEELLQYFPSENKTLVQCLEQCFQDRGEFSTCGYSLCDFYTNLKCIAVLDAASQDTLIKKALKKQVEAKLNEFLNVKDYRVIGLKTLSRTMETLYSIDSFKSLHDLDKGICALVFLLLCLDNPSDVAVYSCYAEYILLHEIKTGEKLAERNSKGRKIVQYLENNETSLTGEIEYIREHADAFKSKITEDHLLTSIVLFQVFDRFTSVERIETLITNKKIDIMTCILYRYSLEEWNKIPLEERAWIVYKIAIGDQMVYDSRGCAIWFPFTPEEKEPVDISKMNMDDAIKDVENMIRKYKHMKQEIYEKSIPYEYSEEHDLEQKERINQLERESNTLRTQLKEVRSENHELTSKLDQIQSKKDSEKLSQEERQELHRLREFVFGLKSEEDSVDVKNIDEDVIRNAGTIVLIGGHSTLYRKLQNKYENIRCIDGRKRVSFDMIHDASCVFFLFDFISHGSYYQGCNECNKANVPYWYVQGTNLERAEKQMIDALKSFDKAKS